MAPAYCSRGAGRAVAGRAVLGGLRPGSHPGRAGGRGYGRAEVHDAGHDRDRGPADQVTAVYICYGDDEDDRTRQFKQAWDQWYHQVPLVTLFSPHRSLGEPIVNYLRQQEQQDPHRRLVVLISELEPMRRWQWILHNQRGLVLDRAIRNGTGNVVICRMRFRPTTWSAN